MMIRGFSKNLRFPFVLQLFTALVCVLILDFLSARFVEKPIHQRYLIERYSERSASRVDILSGIISDALHSNNQTFPVNRFNDFASSPVISEALFIDCDSNIHIAKNPLLTGQNLLSPDPTDRLNSTLANLDSALYIRGATTGIPLSRVLADGSRIKLNPIKCFPNSSSAQYPYAVLVMFFDWSPFIEEDLLLVNNVLKIDRIKWLTLITLILGVALVLMTPRIRKLLDVYKAAFAGNTSKRYGHGDLYEIDLLGQAYDDLTNRFETELSAIEEKSQNYALGHAAFQNSKQAICILSSEQRVTDISPSYEKLTGYTRNEVIGRSLMSLLPDSLTDGNLESLVSEKLIDGTEHETWGYRKDGSRFRKTIRISTKRNADGSAENYFCVERDISQEYAQRKELELIAKTDYLTGLYNRRKFDTDIQECFTGGQTDFALGVIDLDNTREINSEYGIQAGDKIIKEAGRRLLLAVSGTNHTAYRIEGDEFFVLFQGVASQQDLKRRAQAVLSNLMGEANVYDWQIELTAGFGIAMFNQDTHINSNALLRDADSALRHAKSIGRSNIVYAEDYVLSAQRRQTSISLALKSPKLTNQLQLLYSPKIDVQNGILAGAESSLSWSCPQLGFISQEEFLRVAEQTGDITRIGDWASQKAVIDAANFSQQISGFQTTISLPPRQVLEPFFAESFISQLRAQKLSPECIVLEIKDWETIDNYDFSRSTLQTLHAAGISIQINDFGIGYASFSILQQLPVDMLKIDSSFIKDIEENRSHLNIIKTIISLAHLMNIQVIAEGVENNAQLNLLRNLGCDFCHGYLYSEPTSLLDSNNVASIIDNWQESIDSVLS